MVYSNLELPFGQNASGSYEDILKSILFGDLNFHDEGSDYASHNFHSFPAKFPPQLPKAFIEKLTRPGEIILDPMMGSGTCVLESYLSHRQAIGFDIDPLALRIAQVKTTPLPVIEILNLSRTILQRSKNRVQEQTDQLQQDFQSRFDQATRNFINQWFFPQTQLELLAMLQEIERVENPGIKRFFEVCFSAIIITKSGGVSLALDLGHTRPHLPKKIVDRNGNVLRGPVEAVPSYQSKIIRSVFNEFEKRVAQNIKGIPSPDKFFLHPKIELGNVQNLNLANASVDLIVTSPPYASNAIDYMRAHKFSLAWLNYSIADLTEKRKEYIGGESTAEFQYESLPLNTSSVVERISQKDAKKALVLHRYYSEMTRAIAEMYRVLKVGKSAIIVVGNSIMRGEETHTAECLAEIGSTLGFSVVHIGVRSLDRDKRMMPVGMKLNMDSQIQQRMHEEYVIGFLKQ